MHSLFFHYLHLQCDTLWSMAGKGSLFKFTYCTASLLLKFQFFCARLISETVAFQIKIAINTMPYTHLSINKHLLYGDINPWSYSPFPNKFSSEIARTLFNFPSQCHKFIQFLSSISWFLWYCRLCRSASKLSIGHRDLIRKSKSVSFDARN